MRALLLLLTLTAALFADVPSQRVGLPLLLNDIYIPGGEVKPAPRRDREPPLVIRMLDIKSAQDGHRYDLEIQALEPGRHNLADHLVSADPARTAEIPPIIIDITSGLPAGIVMPRELEPSALPPLGGYRRTMVILLAFWVAGLGLILLWKTRRADDELEIADYTPSLAERLRPLVAAASTGNIDDSRRAQLERLVIGHWRQRLPEIAALPPAEAMGRLRKDPEAAPLILALERWLHARVAATSPAEMEELLSPYR